MEYRDPQLEWKIASAAFALAIWFWSMALVELGGAVGRQSLVWKVRLKLGQEAGNEATTFFKVEDIAADPKGNFYVLDAGRPAIQCFDPNGQFLGKISLSKGKGPGEVIEPRKLAVSHENDLVLVDPQLRRLYFFDRIGKTRRTVRLPDTYPVGACRDLKLDKRGNIWIVHKDMEKNNALHAYSPKGVLLRSLVTVKPLKLGALWPLPFTGYFDWYEDRIIFLRETPYEISLHDTSGALLLKFQTDKSLLQPPRVIRRGAGFILPSFDRSVFVANISDQYVLSQVVLVSRKEARYDLFDIKSGRLVAMRSDPLDEALQLLAVKGDTLYATTDVAGYPEVFVLTLEMW